MRNAADLDEAGSPGTRASGLRRRDLARAGGATLAWLLLAHHARLIAQPGTDIPSPEASGEVYAILLSSQKTVVTVREGANRKVLDLRDQLDVQRKRVSQLEVEVREGRAKAHELSSEAAKVGPLQQQLFEALAAQDREYALSMYDLRRRLFRLTSDPAGLAAVAKFRAGDYAVALTELDRQAAQRLELRVAQRARDDAAAAPEQDPKLAADLKEREQRRRNAEDAQDLRDIVLLAWEAIGRPGVPSSEVERRLQAVVKLDPTLTMDNVLLARLFRQRGAFNDMVAASRTALRFALPDRDRALALSELGSAARLAGRLKDARAFLQEALELRKRQWELQRDAADLQRYVSVAYERLGELEMDEGRYAAALDQFAQATAQRRKLTETDSPAPSARSDLALALGQAGRALVERGDVARARDVLVEALREGRRAVDRDPSAPEPRRDLAVLLAREGDRAMLDGQLDNAGKAYDESLKLRRGLIRDDPNSRRLTRDEAVVLVKQADLLLRREGPSTRVDQAYGDVLTRLPDAPNDAALAGDLRRDRLVVKGKKAWLQVLSGQPRPALPDLSTLASAWRDVDRDQPDQPVVWRDEALALTRYGSALMDADQWKEARVPLDIAREKREALMARDPQARSAQAGAAHVYSQLALLYQHLNDSPRARDWAQRAQRLFSDLMRSTDNTLDGVPDSPELVVSIAQMTDALNDTAYAERIAPALKGVRQRLKLSPRDQSRVLALRHKAFQ